MFWLNHHGRLCSDDDDPLPGAVIKELMFYHPDEEEGSNMAEDTLYGVVDIVDGRDTATEIRFGPISQPKHASRKLISSNTLGQHARYKVALMFLGSGYLTVRLPKELAMGFMAESLPYDPPNAFLYGKIFLDDEESEMSESENQPPSPRETWFELHHSMGWRRSGF
ncbi:hypothetical protein B0T14DRAFT_18826 [Immersiella caudata]|uniref:Uncharacterized protein n=1 Tax=Immersiella caudata TaxID=314043 RepID=A0AA39XE78_9PEZI|nr:hypothetical protein B0T14DRAFT_18826 [Immersiella caudata]